MTSISAGIAVQMREKVKADLVRSQKHKTAGRHHFQHAASRFDVSFVLSQHLQQFLRHEKTRTIIDVRGRPTLHNHPHTTTSQVLLYSRRDTEKQLVLR